MAVITCGRPSSAAAAPRPAEMLVMTRCSAVISDRSAVCWPGRTGARRSRPPTGNPVRLSRAARAEAQPGSGGSGPSCALVPPIHPGGGAPALPRSHLLQRGPQRSAAAITLPALVPTMRSTSATDGAAGLQALKRARHPGARARRRPEHQGRLVPEATPGPIRDKGHHSHEAPHFPPHQPQTKPGIQDNIDMRHPDSGAQFA